MGTITKALNLLNYFSDTAPELGLMEVKTLSRQDKATVYRHLCELEANGFLEQNPVSRKYRLGVAVLRLAAVRERTFPARSIVQQWVDRLSDEVRELVHASLIQNNAMSALYFRDASISGTRVIFSEAEMLPLHATASGLAALAFGPPALLERALSAKLQQYSQFTVTSPQDLKALVEQARANGYGFADQYFESEVCSVAAPLFDGGDHAIGAIAIAVPATRMNEASKARFVQALWLAADGISRELGGAIPDQLKAKWRAAEPAH